MSICRRIRSPGGHARSKRRGDGSYDVVNRRYNDDRRTIVTTNHTAAGLETHVGPATFWRIFERATWLTLSGNLRRSRPRTRGAA